MKKFFSLVLALVMALSLTTVAWGAPVTTATELKNALEGSGEVVLANDVTLNGEVSIINVAGDVTLTATSPVTIDASGVSEPFNVTGKLTIGANVTITTDTYLIGVYGGEVVVNAGAKITSTSATHCAFDVSTGGKMTVNEGSEITGVGSMIGVTGGTLNIMGGTVSCNTAFAAAFVYAGTINVYGGEVKNGQDPADSCALIAAGDTAVVNVYGGTVESVLAHVYAGSKVNIEGGTITKDVSAKDGGSVAISGGTVVGDVIENTGSTVTITGGTFSSDVSDYVAAGSRFDVATGEVTAMPATGVGKYDLYDQDGDLAEENITAEYTDSYEKKGAGNIGYWKLTVDGVTYSYYIECSRTKAEMYLTLADNTGVYKYLKHVEYVDYVATGKAYTNIGDDCGELDVGAKAKAYVLTDEDGNKTYWIADEDGDTVIMVGDELVLVSEVEGGLVPHTWVVTAYNDDEEPITAKCKECPATAKLYKTKLAAPVGATFAGQIAGYYVVVDGTTPSTDKVQSAETFDAGIAMYVGMSVMAAAGSAVVLKKRED